MGEAFLEYFRTPDDLAISQSRGNVELLADYDARDRQTSEPVGYFRFGDVVCYGRRRGGPVATSATDALPDATRDERLLGALPFDLSEVVANLRHERYMRAGHGGYQGLIANRAAQAIYYFFRPVLSVPMRKHLQKMSLQGWDRIPFPAWPVDVSVDGLMRGAMSHLLRTGAVERIPFVWFWPDGAPNCLMLTHDVEGTRGRAFCRELMDLDDAYGIKAAFQIIPEEPGQTIDDTKALIAAIRLRGFEVNLHDLNHDGRLFANRREFVKRAARINHYARELACRGFRSGAMYRNQDWFDAFEFSFDMSVPSVAHLEPQRGGCCTVMPYFVGRVLELPLTTIQDYSLFHILGDYSIDRWKEQIERIRDAHGLISIITHPDYLREHRALAVYTDLLKHLRTVSARESMWVARPSEINRWWRERQQMSLVREGDVWRVTGPGSARARVAYAALEGDRVTYRVSSRS